MRKAGVVLSKFELNREAPWYGDLVIRDTLENGFNRVVKLAEFMRGEDRRRCDFVLYDPHILWMSGSKFVLAGFERCKEEGGQVRDYAQSWLCDTSPRMSSPPR